MSVQKEYVGQCTGSEGQSSYLSLDVGPDGTCAGRSRQDFKGNECAGDAVSVFNDGIYDSGVCIQDQINDDQWNFKSCSTVDATENDLLTAPYYTLNQWNNIAVAPNVSPNFPQFTTCSSTEPPTSVFMWPLNICSFLTSWTKAVYESNVVTLKIYEDADCLTPVFNLTLGPYGDTCENGYNNTDVNWQRGAITQEDASEPTILPTEASEPKCLWANDCASDPSSCEKGTYCIVFEYWSQCRENLDLSTNNCHVTVNGPYSGERYGCMEDTDCCNPEAKCGADKLCHLSCTISTQSQGSYGTVSNDGTQSGVDTVVLVPVMVGLGLLVIFAALSLYYFFRRNRAASKSEALGTVFENQSNRDSLDIIEAEAEAEAEADVSTSQ